MLNTSIWPIGRTLSDVTTPGQSGRDCNEGVLRITQSSSISEASPSDCLMIYLEILVGESYPFIEDDIGVFYSPSRPDLGSLKIYRKENKRYTQAYTIKERHYQ